MTRTLRTTATLASLLGLAAVAPAAQATPRAIFAAVNYEREMAGLQPLTWSQDLADSCQRHAGYMASSNTLTHAESSGASGYSEGGAWAGANSVLARSSVPFSGNPWAHAPFHEFQLMHPWLGSTGVGEAGGFACMVTGGERDAPNPSSITLTTVPGTAQYTTPAEIARESPYTPGDEVGLPQGTKTGPHLYVYAQGPQRFESLAIGSASLTAANGSQVPLRWVDGTSARSARFVQGGAILIPVTPLLENTTYGLRIEATTVSPQGTRLTISRSSSFITGPDESDLVRSPEASDTVTAASTRGQRTPRTTRRSGSKTKRVTQVSGSTAIVGEAGAPQLKIALKWTRTGVRAKITCASDAARCEGPVRILVRRKGSKIQKLRFKARRGPLKLSLAPGRTIKRRIIMTDRQIASGHKRGFAIRWKSAAASKARTLEVE